MTPLDVIVIRGAPGSGKSETAKHLAVRLGTGVRMEVDALRAMVIDVEWTDQSQHISALSLAASLIAGFLEVGHRPVIVVDTFSGDKLAEFLAKLRTLRTEVQVALFALIPSQVVLRARLKQRSGDRFKDVPVCEKLNEDTAKYLQPGERMIDNSALTPAETADAILGCCLPNPEKDVVRT